MRGAAQSPLVIRRGRSAGPSNILQHPAAIVATQPLPYPTLPSNLRCSIRP